MNTFEFLVHHCIAQWGETVCLFVRVPQSILKWIECIIPDPLLIATIEKDEPWFDHILRSTSWDNKPPAGRIDSYHLPDPAIDVRAGNGYTSIHFSFLDKPILTAKLPATPEFTGWLHHQLNRATWSRIETVFSRISEEQESDLEDQ